MLVKLYSDDKDMTEPSDSNLSYSFLFIMLLPEHNGMQKEFMYAMIPFWH
jgi:hypothetical protein